MPPTCFRYIQLRPSGRPAIMLWSRCAPASPVACPRHAQEVGILKSLNYDRNIVQFYGACLRPGGDPLLVCEYMEGETCTRIAINTLRVEVRI